MKKCIKSLFFLTTILVSCDDVFEEDISDENITIIAPKDGASLEGNAVQFRWTSLDGADDYRLQIFSDNNQSIVFDSLVYEPILNHQIDPGEYSWRVRGENFAYTTPYTFDSSFSIVASPDLTNQLITLQSPQDNIFTNNKAITFSWQAIGTADVYEFNLLKIEGGNKDVLFQDDNLISPTISINSETITEDAEYEWQVKAKNESSETKFFSRNFFLDTENPPIPTLTTPALNQIFTTTQEVSFTWNFDDTGEIQSPLSATIDIASNENFATIVLTETSDNVEFQNTFTTAGTYYWRVRGIDDAGNIGAFSTTGSVVIN